MKKLFIGKLPFSASESDLHSLFEEFGPLVSAKIVMDHATGRSRGFGFVEIEDDERADKAIEALNGAQMDRFNIVVSEARAEERRPRPQGGGFRGGREGGRGGDDRGFRGGNRGGRGGNSW